MPFNFTLYALILFAVIITFSTILGLLIHRDLTTTDEELTQ